MEKKVYHPVDHGWAWMICLGTGVNAFFVVGCLKSMGVMFMTLVERFDAPPSIAGLTLGLLAGGFAVFAMLSNAVSVIIGFRVTLLFGAILCVTSAILSIFATNIYFVIITLGLCQGLAFGAMSTPSVVLLNMHFDKRKSFANGLAMMGSSIGQLTLPYAMTYFMDEFGFQGAMLLYSGICLQTIPAALIMRPLEFWMPKSKKPETFFSRFRCNSGGKSDDGGSMKPVVYSQGKGSDPIGTEERKDKKALMDTSYSKGALYLKGKTASKSKSVSSLHRSRLSLHQSRTSLYGSQISLKKSRTLAESSGSIMLGLSLEHLPPLAPEDVDSVKAHTKKPNFCQVLFDKDLMKSVTFWILFWSLGIGHAGFIDACLYLPSLAYERFNSKYTGAIFIMIMGGFDIIGKLGGGAIADLGFIRRTHLAAIAMIVTGSATLFFMFKPTFIVLVIYSVTMGLIGGTYRILMPVLIRDLFGPTKLSSGVGLCYLNMGLVILPMPTLLGYMQQVFHTYIPSMMLCGSLLIFGAVLMFTLPLWQRFDAWLTSRSSLYLDDTYEKKDPEKISFTMEVNSRENISEHGELQLGNSNNGPSDVMTEKDIEDIKI